MHHLRHITLRFLATPRLVRLLAVSIIALAYVMLVFPLVDQLYVTYFFDPTTVIVPSLISASIGAFVYSIGWIIIINPRIQPPPAYMPALIYITLGLLVLFADIVLITMGITMLEIQ